MTSEDTLDFKGWYYETAKEAGIFNRIGTIVLFPWLLFLPYLFPPLLGKAAAGCHGVECRTHFHPENAPHSGLYIPAKRARAVEIVAGTVGSTTQQLQIVYIAHADGTLHCPHIGQRIIRLLPPSMPMDQEANISGFISRHQIADDHPLLCVGLEHRSGRLPMHLRIKQFIS